MILTVLVGNTNTRIHLFRGRRVFLRRVVPTGDFLARPASWIPTDRSVKDAACATVVRPATKKVAAAIRKQTGITPFMPDERCRTGMNVRYDRKQLGQDRLCVAAGARAKYPGNLIVLDFGTAVTVNFVTEAGTFIGGPIIPGQALILESLSRTRARLPRVSSGRKKTPVCRSTEEAMAAGARMLLCTGLQNIVRTLKEFAGGAAMTVATGGGAEEMRRDIPGIDRVDPDLAARGLLELCLMNR